LYSKYYGTMKYIIFIVLVCSLLIMTVKCTQETSVLDNTDLIFHDSYYLKIKPYIYLGEQNKSYSCHGDTFFYLQIPDTFDTRPLLKWDSMGFKILTVAIFTSPIVVEDNTIKNSRDIRWQWNSGMEFGIEGTVKYSEGKSVKNDIVDYTHEPDNLVKGHYYWAVWGWNPEGTKILYSTRQMSFYVQ
jgi:hypothetical protein